MRLRHSALLSGVAVLPWIAACGSDSTSPPPAPASVSSAAGSGQTATVGQLLGTALAVVVRDDGGQPFAGATVQWAATSGGGSVSPASSTSDANGMATTQWTLGGAAGQQAVTATVSGLTPVTFTATAQPDVPAQVTVTPTSAEITALGGTIQLAAAVADQFGNALSGVGVDWASADDATVSVTAAGLARGLALGNADVTATVTGGSASGSVNVNVTQVPASVTVDPGAGQVLVGGTLQVAADVRDANANPIASPGVTWASSNEAILTVDANGLVMGVAEGFADVTATAGGASGSAPVQVVFQAPDFEPTADTDIDGDRTFDDVIIPAGVTVTFTSGATITVQGDMDIDGTVRGDCVRIEFLGQGQADYGGTFDNSCAGEPDEGGPDLRLVNDGPLNIDGATFTYAGTLEIKNDPALVDDDNFLPGPAAASGAAQLGDVCIVVGGTFVPSSPSAASGSDGDTFGGNGRNAKKVSLTCSGDLIMNGGTTVEARDGGAGGDAGNPDPGSDDATGRGGNGGDGGNLNVRAEGDITFDDLGGGTVLNLASGGRGGDAVVPGREPGGNAEAEGGAGGDGGNMRVEAKGSITIDDGGLTINVGNGGRGGHATATGGNGADAGAGPATNGGTATATGGAGGHSVDGKLRASGGVNGAGRIVLTGGDGGVGGQAQASGGNGGKGNDEFPDGADGGDMSVTGGMGGMARTRDITGTTIGTSGDGGDVFVSLGMGGRGKDRCHLPTDGGEGGWGGEASGMPGTGGTGDNPGTAGAINVAGGTGDAGDGGDGAPVGFGGTSRGDLMTGTRNPPAGPAFQDGEDGDDCIAYVTIAVSSDPNGHDPFVGLSTVTQFTFTIEGTTILMTGPAPFVDLSGTIDAEGNFSVTGAGTLAGFPNVDVVFEGVLKDGVVTGTLTADADNDQFPPDGGGNRNPVVYNVTGTVPPPIPVPPAGDGP